MLKKLLVVTVVVGLAASTALLAGKAGRWAGKGAAGGAIAGLLIGGDLGSAAVGAAVGAAGAGAAGAASSSKDKKQAQQQAEAEAQAAAEQQAAEAAAAARSDGLPESEEEWIAAIGEDNFNALDALVDCEHDRAAMLAKVSGTSDDAEFRTIGVWLEALTALDQSGQSAAEDYYEKIVPMDDEIDTVQQASLKADQVILKIRDTREDEGISCSR
jgi:hypothetical protein